MKIKVAITSENEKNGKEARSGMPNYIIPWKKSLKSYPIWSIKQTLE